MTARVTWPIAGLCAMFAWALPGCFQAFVVPPEPDPIIDEVSGVVALAGPDLVVVQGSRVALSGAASRSVSGSAELSWAQVSGPPVLLSNPSSAFPVFIAPIAPATVEIELVATAGAERATDRMRIVVADALGRPGFVEAPADRVAEPGSTQTVDVTLAPRGARGTITARDTCAGGADVRVTQTETGATVDVTLPDVLPCMIVFDAVDDSDSGLAPAAMVFWPAGTGLPDNTTLTLRGPSPEPGSSFTLETGDDGSPLLAWSANGLADVLPGGTEGDTSFTAPRRQTQLVIAAERRLAGASGGVAYLLIDVRSESNAPPVADGGPDRIVRPGARFRIDTKESFDLDPGTVLTVSVSQVLGPAATPVGDGVFEAPTELGELLFHVVADDSIVQSEPDPVLVRVSNDVENVPPAIGLAPRRLVTPGETFVISRNVADDPDSGFVAAFTVQQDENDPQCVLLCDPDGPPGVAQDTAVITAVADGDVYHFSISASDEEGLVTTVIHEVVVEEAGPYVDPVRGVDGGNGTVDAPFLTIGDAIDTAVAHQFDALLLAEGAHAETSIALPRGLSLVGGHRFDGAEYVEDEVVSTVPVGVAGIVVDDATINNVDLGFAQGAGAVRLEGTSRVIDSALVAGAEHAGALIVVAGDAAARLERVRLTPGGAAGPGLGTVVVEAQATALLASTTIDGASGDQAVAIACENASLFLDGSDLTAALVAAEARGIEAIDCSVDVSDSIIRGGGAARAFGIFADDGFVTLDALTSVIGATADAEAATAVSAENGAVALLRGVLSAAVDGVVVAAPAAVVSVDAPITLAQAEARVAGDGATAISVDGADVKLESVVVLAEGAGATALSLADAQLVTVRGSIITADIGLSGRALRVNVETSQVTSTSRALSLPTRDSVVIDRSELASGTADAADVIAVEAQGAFIVDSTITATGLLARGLVLGSAGSAIQRTAIAANADDAIGVTHAGTLTILSSFVSVEGGPAISSAGALTVRHGTLFSDGAAISLSSNATLEIANTLLVGSPGVASAKATPWSRAVAVAFDEATTFVTLPGEDVTDLQRVRELGCDICLDIVASQSVDETGHLLAGDNALVDVGDASQSVDRDIDNEVRDARPDIGCDERL